MGIFIVYQEYISNHELHEYNSPDTQIPVPISFYSLSVVSKTPPLALGSEEPNHELYWLRRLEREKHKSLKVS